MLNVDELDIEMKQTTDVSEEELLGEINAENEDVQEMSEEEQRQFFIEQLKKMKMRFNPVKQKGNVTINPYGTEYKQKRKKKNRQVKASRRTNRKK